MHSWSGAEMGGHNNLHLLIYLTLDLSSSRIQMATLDHTSTPFCFVIRQLLGFFPGQVHLSKVPFDDIYPVLPRSSWLSLVTSQFPVCCLTSCSRVVRSQDVSQPPEPSFFNYIFQLLINLIIIKKLGRSSLPQVVQV